MSSGVSGFPRRGAVAYPDIEPREIRVATFINVHEWTFRQVVFVFYVSIGNLILVNYVQRYYFSIKPAIKSREKFLNSLEKCKSNIEDYGITILKK